MKFSAACHVASGARMHGRTSLILDAPAKDVQPCILRHHYGTRDGCATSTGLVLQDQARRFRSRRALESRSVRQVLSKILRALPERLRQAEGVWVSDRSGGLDFD